MQRFAMFAAAAAYCLLVPGTVPSLASDLADRESSAIEVSAQDRYEPVRRRPRTQLRVSPRYPYRNYHTFYPLPYPIEYPGPNAVRHCVAKLVPENRPSGPVIVPRMRCWWARG